MPEMGENTGNEGPEGGVTVTQPWLRSEVQGEAMYNKQDVDVVSTAPAFAQSSCACVRASVLESVDQTEKDMGSPTATKDS